jgi:hypothetical protein
MKRLPLTFISFAPPDPNAEPIGVFIAGEFGAEDACKCADRLGLNPGKGWQAVVVPVPGELSEAEYRKCFDFVGKQITVDEMREVFGARQIRDLTPAEMAHVRARAGKALNQ